MELTLEQIASLAPDEKASAAGKKIAAPKNWLTIGRSPVAVWGACQGSATYQVKVDLGQFAYNCTCPSHKLPCKHVLGLLMLLAESPGAAKESEAPEWVSDWLTKRQATAQKRAEKLSAPAKPVDTQAQAKRVAQRQEKILAGLDRLDLWMEDVIRGGLAGVEKKAPSFWETEASRLVDAQATGLATRIRRISEIPGSHAQWPQRLLDELGRLALLTHAYRRRDDLEEKLRADIRQLVGWAVSQEELTTTGEVVEDDWLLLAQEFDNDERVRVQRNWLVGRETQRKALVLQFAPGGQPYPDSFSAGIEFRGELLFYPGVRAERAQIKKRADETSAIVDAPPGAQDLEAFFQELAESLARQPWVERFFGVIHNVRPVLVSRDKNEWFVADIHDKCVPMKGRSCMELLARSGGNPVHLAGVWNGEYFEPLGIYDDQGYRPIFRMN
jgi:hypothetical protein